MSKVRQATSIPKKVKGRVYERDKGLCILCGRLGLPEAHYIPRSQLGLGIEENIVTLCRECHRRLDNSPERRFLLERVKLYLQSKYPDWNEKNLVYRRWNYEADRESN